MTLHVKTPGSNWMRQVWNPEELGGRRTHPESCALCPPLYCLSSCLCSLCLHIVSLSVYLSLSSLFSSTLLTLASLFPLFLSFPFLSRISISICLSLSLSLCLYLLTVRRNNCNIWQKFLRLPQCRRSFVCLLVSLTIC